MSETSILRRHCMSGRLRCASGRLCCLVVRPFSKTSLRDPRLLIPIAPLARSKIEPRSKSPRKAILGRGASECPGQTWPGGARPTLWRAADLARRGPRLQRSAKPCARPDPGVSAGGVATSASPRNPGRALSAQDLRSCHRVSAWSAATHFPQPPNSVLSAAPQQCRGVAMRTTLARLQQCLPPTRHHLTARVTGCGPQPACTRRLACWSSLLSLVSVFGSPGAEATTRRLTPHWLAARSWSWLYPATALAASGTRRGIKACANERRNGAQCRGMRMARSGW